METILREKITNELLDALLYKSETKNNKWLVTKTIFRMCVIREENIYMLTKEHIGEDRETVICGLVYLKDLYSVLKSINDCGGIHDMIKMDNGDIVERPFDIGGKIFEYYMKKEEEVLCQTNR